MKVYVAADFGRASEAEQIAVRLESEAAARVVSSWHRVVQAAEAAAAGSMGGPPDAERARAAAERNLRELRQADVVVVLATGTPARGGRHFETGYAAALGKPVVVVGPVEHAFHHLPGTELASADTLLECLRRLDASTNQAR